LGKYFLLHFFKSGINILNSRFQFLTRDLLNILLRFAEDFHNLLHKILLHFSQKWIFIKVEYMAAAFGKFKESSYSGDYIKNKKEEAMLCSSVKCIRRTGGTSVLNKKKVEDSCDIYPFNKSNLIVNLYSKLDLANVKTICNGTSACNTGDLTTNIDVSTAPLYQNYIIDPNGTLFGTTPCSTTNYTKYIVPDVEEEVA